MSRYNTRSSTNIEKLRPFKKRRLGEDTVIIHDFDNMSIDDSCINTHPIISQTPPSESYRPYRIRGKTYYICSNRECQLRFDSSDETFTTRYLQAWVEVQTAVDSICKLIGSLPEGQSISVVTLFSQNNWNSVMSKNPGKHDPIIWTESAGLVTKFTV